MNALKLWRQRKAQPAKTLDIPQQMLAMAEDARKMANSLDGKISAAKEAMVRLTGEYLIAAMALTEINDQISSISAKVDEALQTGKEATARSLIAEQEKLERRTKSYAESMDILRPKVEDMQARVELLISTKDDAMHEAGVLDAKARSLQTIQSMSQLAGDSFGDEADMEMIRATSKKFEAYAEAVDEVTKSELTTVVIPRVSAVDGRLAKRKAELGIV